MRLPLSPGTAAELGRWRERHSLEVKTSQGDNSPLKSGRKSLQ